MNNFIQDINKLNNNKSIDKKEDNYFNSLANETFSRNEKNSDVINLSELSKIKLEYERDDVKMNNGQINNNFGQPELNQGPAFGGRFFPSLEDEPTNMNMMGGLNNGPSIPQTPVTPEPMGVPVSPNINNNLIDLTDLSIEKAPNSMATPNTTPTMTYIPESIGISTSPADKNMSQSGNFVEPMAMPSVDQPMNMSTLNPMVTNDLNNQTNNSFELPNTGVNPMPSLDSLQNNNPSGPLSTEPVSMDILNADFGAPQPMPNIGTNAAPEMPTMPEPMEVPTPSMDINVPQNGGFGAQMTIPSLDQVQQPMMEDPQPMPNIGTNAAPEMPTMPEPMEVPTPSIDINVPQNGGFGAQMTIPSFNPIQQPMMEDPQPMPNIGTNAAPEMPTMPELMGVLTPPADINMPQNENFVEPMTIPNFDTNAPLPTFDNNMGMPNMDVNTTSQKDVTPVTNTIKNLVNSLKEFGYNINIIEDDLINVSKLTIEIEK